MSCSLKQKASNKFNISIKGNSVEIKPEMEQGVWDWVNSENKKLERVDLDKYMEFDGTILSFDPVYEDPYNHYIGLVSSLKEYEEAERNADLLAAGIAIPESDEEMSYPDIPFVDLDVNAPPADFSSWVTARQQTIEKLDRVAASYRKRLGDKEYVTKLSKVNNSIGALKKQLTDFADREPKLMQESIIRETVLLQNMIDSINKNYSIALGTIESNDLESRVEELSKYFIGEDLYGNKHEPLLSELVRNTFPREIVDEIRNKIMSLRSNYNALSVGIVESMFENDDVIKEHRKNMSPEDWRLYHEAVIKIIRENRAENLNKGNYALSGNLVNLLPMNLLVNMKDAYYNSEVGETEATVQRKNELLKKIQEETGNAKEAVKSLYKRDVFGQVTPMLLSMYDDSFNPFAKQIGDYRLFYFRNKSNASYNLWMTSLKENTEIIEPYKLKSFYDKYRDNPIFSEFFIYSESEMSDYENQMRARFGNAVFEVESKKLAESIGNYAMEHINSTFGSEKDKYYKNPMSFIRNFHSDNYRDRDSTTGFFLEPDFVRYFPKNHINQEFLDIEKNGSKNLVEFWKVTSELERYANRIAQSEGIRVKNGEILNDRDGFAELNAQETWKQAKFFKYLDIFRKDEWRNWILSFANLQDIKVKEGKGNIISNYFSYNKSLNNKYRKMYHSMSSEKLLELFNESGLDISKIPNDYNKDERENTMIEGLIQQRTNKTTKYDLNESINRMVGLARDIRARRNSEGMSGHILRYFKNSGDGTETGDGLDYATRSINMNIKGQNWGRELVQANGKSLRNTTARRRYTSEEEEYMEIARLLGHGYDASNLGTTFTAGSIVMGLKSMMSFSMLSGVNVVSNTNNRLAGDNQITNAAAGLEFGFGIDENTYSKRFLFGDNTLKYYLKLRNSSPISKILGVVETKRFKKIQTIKIFADGLRLLDNVNNIVDNGVMEGDSAIKKLRHTLMDFSVNNPEWKSQAQLLLNIMQIVKVKDKHGNEHPIFNGKTGEFIYIPGTLQLKDEFDTEDNRLNWSNFTQNKEGFAPQNLLTSWFKIAKAKTLGEYDPSNKAPVEDTVTGRVSLGMIKWFAGNTDRQFGSNKVDIAFGKLNNRGNKLVLMEHTPTLLTYMLSSHGGRFVNIIKGFGVGLGLVSASTVISVGFGVSATAGAIVLLHRHRRLKAEKGEKAGETATAIGNALKQFTQKDELLLLLSMGIETAALTLNIMAGNLYMNSPINNKKLRELNYRMKPVNLSEEERNKLSSCAADIAQQIQTFVLATITSTLMAAAYALARPEDDDEEAQAEYDRKFFKYLDRSLNSVNNIANNVYADFHKFTNPTAFLETGSAQVFLNNMNGLYEKLIVGEDDKGTLWEQYSNGEITGGELTLGVVGEVGKFTGLPGFMIKAIKDPLNMIGTEKAYDEGTSIAKVRALFKPQDENFNEAVKVYAGSIKKDILSAILTHDENNTLTVEERKQLVTTLFNDLVLEGDAGLKSEYALEKLKDFTKGNEESKKLNTILNKPETMKKYIENKVIDRGYKDTDKKLKYKNQQEWLKEHKEKTK